MSAASDADIPAFNARLAALRATLLAAGKLEAIVPIKNGSLNSGALLL